LSAETGFTLRKLGSSKRDIHEITDEHHKTWENRQREERLVLAGSSGGEHKTVRVTPTEMIDRGVPTQKLLAELW
jgi:hypothetical protein